MEECRREMAGPHATAGRPRPLMKIKRRVGESAEVAVEEAGKKV